MTKIALGIKTHFDLGNSVIQPEKLANKLVELGYNGAVIADTNLAASVDIFKAFKEKGLRAILGLQSLDNLLIPKNKAGWFELVQFRNGISDKLDNVYQTILTPGFTPICYLNEEDQIDHKIVFCMPRGYTFENIKDYDESKYTYLHKDSQLFHDIDQIEEFSILEKPRLPKFKEGIDSNESLRELCRTGWENIINSKNLTDEQEREYLDRIKYELEVLQKANLADYFLIVADLYKFIEDNKWARGPGRGSVGGCLTAYLTNITQVDPIKYDLLFERFWNPARADKLPDIDCDVPTAHREEIIEYLRTRYGHDKIYQMCTYNTSKGRGAIQDVLRIRGGASPQERMEITKHIPDEAKIMGDLQEMKEAGEESSIILWSLQNNVEKLREWCYINRKGELEGPLAKRFEQAIRLEGTIKNISKHAAGITLSDQPLAQICPLVKDPHSEKMITEIDMYGVEELGIIKLDVLGLSVLDKVMTCLKLIQSRRLSASTA